MSPLGLGDLLKSNSVIRYCQKKHNLTQLKCPILSKATLLKEPKSLLSSKGWAFRAKNERKNIPLRPLWPRPTSKKSTPLGKICLKMCEKAGMESDG